MRIVLSLALLAFMFAPTQAADIDSAIKDIGGAWQMDFTTPDGEYRTPVIIVGQQYDDLVAWYVKDGESQEFDTVRLEDETLVLSFRPKEVDGNIKVTFKAQLSGDNECKGEADFAVDGGESGTFDFTGKRYNPSDFDEVSKWSLSFVTPDDEQREATVTVVSKDGKTYAWYSSENHELPAKKITHDGEEIALSVTAKTRDGATVDVTFRGTLDGDSVKGDAEYNLDGQTGSFPFTGKRKS